MKQRTHDLNRAVQQRTKNWKFIQFTAISLCTTQFSVPFCTQMKQKQLNTSPSGTHWIRGRDFFCRVFFSNFLHTKIAFYCRRQSPSEPNSIHYQIKRFCSRLRIYSMPKLWTKEQTKPYIIRRSGVHCSSGNEKRMWMRYIVYVERTKPTICGEAISTAEWLAIAADSHFRWNAVRNISEKSRTPNWLWTFSCASAFSLKQMLISFRPKISLSSTRNRF